MKSFTRPLILGFLIAALAACAGDTTLNGSANENSGSAGGRWGSVFHF